MKLQVTRLTFRDQLKGFPPRIVTTNAPPVFFVFLVLRLAHVTDWSWWWVSSPLWIPLLPPLAVIALGLVIFTLGAATFALVRWRLTARARRRLTES
jgi:membrane protein YdbS with pleckstrin-like domain